MTNSSDNKLLPVNVLHENYRFTRKIGTGGFSDVFVAERRDSHEYVAIKMIKAGYTDEGLQRKTARFRREMLLYASLEHPNIVKVIDSGETDNGILFIVFEYIKGQNLGDLLKKEGALSITRTMNLMKQVLNGLGAAHGQGIIHRDLKPENIMVVVEGDSDRVKILDFGISTFVQRLSDNRLTMTHEFLGTPVYSAPEQLRGDAVSVKVDIYSWGLIFLECISGKLPFTGQTIPSVVQQQLSSSPIPLPAALINHQLGTLLRWILEKNADRRAGIAQVIISHLETVSIETIPQRDGFLTGNLLAVDSESGPGIMIYETVSAQTECRQVTTLCCVIDIKVATPDISNEILDEIYQDLMETCKTHLKRFRAYVASDSGDRLLSYFGYPDASDTDVRRAVRCALELANIITQRNTVFSKQHGILITFHIGIHTGTITVRKHSQNIPVISGLSLSYAAKLCRSLKENSILVSQNSASLLQKTVELQEVEDDSILNLFPDGHVYTLIGERRCDSLIDAFSGKISPMIGRDGELAFLFDTWKLSRQNSIGKVIFILGEAGIGKSRLVAEFAKRVSIEQEGWLECRCLPEGKNSALHPVFNFLRNQFRISDTSSHNDSHHAFESNLKSFGFDCNIAMPLFCSWLSLTVSGYTMPQLSPQKQKDIIIQLSCEFLARTAQDSDSVIMIEDLHWADPTTLELLPLLFEQVKKRGVMLCLSARPVFVPSWRNTDAEVMTLSGLNDEHVEEVVRTIFGSEEVSHDTLEKIISRVDGVPLFIEEIVRLIREKKLLREEIPETLRDLLTSKMGRLGPARETAQLASVIGRDFDYNLIEKVSNKDVATLLSDLDHLVSAGIIHIRLVVGNPHYVFHHALVRDAAYESVDKKLRKEMHARIAEVLEREFSNKNDISPEILAWHWAGAENFEKAVMWGMKASQDAFKKSQFTEAINHAKKSIMICKYNLQIQNKFEVELQLNQVLVHCLTMTQGFVANEIVAINERSYEIITNLQKGISVDFTYTWQLILYYQSKPDYNKLKSICDNALLHYNYNEYKNERASLYFSKGNFHYVEGSFCKSEEFLKQTISLFDNSDENFRMVYGFDLKVSSYSLLCLLYTVQGKFIDSENAIKQAVSIATSKHDVMSVALSLVYEAGMWHYRNDKEKTMIVAEMLIKHSENKNIPAWNLVGNLYKAWVENDISVINDTFLIWEQYGYGIVLSYWNFLAAQIEYTNKMFNDSLIRLNKYIQYSEERKEYYYLPELYRLAALCYYDLGEYDKCKSYLKKSIGHSKKLNATLFQARTLIAIDMVDRTMITDYNQSVIEVYEFLNKNINNYYEEKDTLKQIIQRIIVHE